MATITIGGELESLASDGIVVSSNHIKDLTLDKLLSDINADLLDSIDTLDSDVQSKITILNDSVSQINDSIISLNEAALNIELNTSNIEIIQSTIETLEDVVLSNYDLINSLLENEMTTEATTREEADNTLDDKIREVETSIGKANINYAGIAVTEEQLNTIDMSMVDSTLWALVGELSNLQLFAYYVGNAPNKADGTKYPTETWVGTGLFYNWGQSVGILSGLNYTLESESLYEQRKTALLVETNKFYFTYED